MEENIRVRSFKGEDSLPYISKLAQLRIEVFREFPYLYDGNMDYEKDYLHAQIKSPTSLVVVAFHNEEVIGASTGMPLSDEMENIQKPWKDHNENIEEIFYFGESVLKKSYRGLGIGNQFFDHRETFASQIPGISRACFCAVIRPENHPLKPNDYRPLDKFWIKRGFKKLDNYQCKMSWKDIDQDHDTTKQLVFWSKPLK